MTQFRQYITSITELHNPRDALDFQIKRPPNLVINFNGAYVPSPMPLCRPLHAPRPHALFARPSFTLGALWYTSRIKYFQINLRLHRTAFTNPLTLFMTYIINNNELQQKYAKNHVRPLSNPISNIIVLLYPHLLTDPLSLWFPSLTTMNSFLVISTHE